jgi:hypothetical protein
MKKTLHNRISKYTAVAGAVVTAAGAQAQVVYTDVNPDYSHDATQNNGFSVYPLDLNNDQTVDFVIASKDSLYAAGNKLRYTLAAPYGAGNAVAGENPGGYDYALALDINSMVDSTLNWIEATNTMAYNVDSANPYEENWNGVTDKYLGLKFVVGGNTHYGWARLDSYAIGDSIVVKDYAFDATPNTGIMTGDMGSVSLTETQVENLIKFVNQSNNSVQVVVNGDLTNGKVSVVSSTGQVVSADDITDKTFSVDMNNLSSGVYMVNVSFSEGSTTKKIIVH